MSDLEDYPTNHEYFLTQIYHASHHFHMPPPPSYLPPTLIFESPIDTILPWKNPKALLCCTLLHSIPCFMAPLNYLLHDAVYKFPCYDTEKTPHLAGIPPNISLLSDI